MLLGMRWMQPLSRTVKIWYFAKHASLLQQYSQQYQYHPSADQQDPIANAKKWVKNALDDLVSTGALQHDNRMNIEPLLNPVAKAQNLDEMTDEEICQAIQDAQRAEYEVTDSGDCGSDDKAPFPTHCEVLQAVSIINSYIDNLDNALAWKLEVILGSFTCQIHLDESHKMTSILMSILPDNSLAQLDAD